MEPPRESELPLTEFGRFIASARAGARQQRETRCARSSDRTLRPAHSRTDAKAIRDIAWKSVGDSRHSNHHCGVARILLATVSGSSSGGHQGIAQLRELRIVDAIGRRAV